MSSKNSVLENFNEQDVKFGDILNKKWKVFRISPIYNFSKEKLRFYEKTLDEVLNSKKNSSSAGYRSKFIVNKNLRLNDECSEAIQVEIVKDDFKTTYLGNFISWSNRKRDSKDSISLPILLVEGKVHEIHVVHLSLCKIFDCDIQPVTFSFCALITFLVKLLETPRNGVDVSQEQIVMEYKVPGCEDNDRIKVSLLLESTIIVFAEVMDNLCEKYHGITTMEIILEFYNKILNHLYHIFKMDLMLAELHVVAFPDAFLSCDGQVKVTTVSAALSTLNVLDHFTPLDAIGEVLEGFSSLARLWSPVKTYVSNFKDSFPHILQSLISSQPE